MTTIMTTTSKGQLTLKRDLLQHLGVNPGERLEFKKLPNGEDGFVPPVPTAA